MSRVCKDLNSPLENFLIILGAILVLIGIIFGGRFVVKCAKHLLGAEDDKNISSVSSVDTNNKNVADGDNGETDSQAGLLIREPDNLPRYVVTHVRDGDTFDIEYNGEKTGVRLIGVDAPESVHPEKPVECYGIESSNYTRERLLDKTVSLELDSSQGDWDDYGRLLAYAYIDGQNYNLELIEEGYAMEYTYNLPYRYADEFKLAQIDAINNQRGLWANCKVSGPAQTISF